MRNKYPRYFAPSGNVDREHALSAPDAVYFEIVPNDCRVREYAQGDPQPIGIPPNFRAVTLAFRKGKPLVFLVDARLRLSDTYDIGALLQLQPSEWPEDLRRRTGGGLLPCRPAICHPE